MEVTGLFFSLHIECNALLRILRVQVIWVNFVESNLFYERLTFLAYLRLN